MRVRLHPIVIVLFVIIACGGTSAWRAPGAPKTPPDEQFLVGVEAGDLVYIWHCYEGSRVLITQSGSCFGTREPVVERGSCSAPLPGEKRFEGYDRDAGARSLADSFRWPDSGAPSAPRP
jgi:hypothetical protein